MRRKGPDEVRRFAEVAKQRYDEAMFLLRGGFGTGAAYLAGYAVECMLKSLWLSRVPARDWPAVSEEFRGAKAHDFEWLKGRYLQNGGETFPPAISKAFTKVNSWRTELRYKPGRMRIKDAEEFLQAVNEIVEWARRRL